jgi:hypothetical protein
MNSTIARKRKMDGTQKWKKKNNNMSSIIA